MKDTTFNGKLFTLLLLRSYKKVLAAVLIGALVIGIPYTLSKTLIGNFNYRSEVTVHVEYGEDTAGNAYDYINYYTWGQWITSDTYVATLLSEYNLKANRDELVSYLGAEVPADQRVVVFTVTTKSQGLTNSISNALADSVTDFVETIPEVKSAEILSRTEAVKYFVYKNIPQSFIFGALLGLFLSLLGLWLTYLLDDSVYIPELFEEKTGLKILEKEEGTVIRIEKKLPELPEDLKGPVTLQILCGAHNGKAVEYVLHECGKRGVEIAGAMLDQVDEKLVKAYYAGTNFPDPFLKEE